ncbi:MAG: glutaredoxin family protein [Candidatus Acidiferrum sp.]|jgi:glutaredoxin
MWLEPTMEIVTMYTTAWCPDCRRAKSFLKERGVEFREVNIEGNPSAEEIVVKANDGKRKVPTLEIGGRYFACSPFDPEQLAEELNIPLNP